MTSEDIIRAWKDQDFYQRLSAVVQANVPANPAGVLAVEHLWWEQQEKPTHALLTAGCCDEPTGLFCGPTAHLLTLGCCGPQ